MKDFREVFSVDNVIKRYEALGFTPARGSYAGRHCCLLGSLEHAMAKAEKRDVSLPTAGNRTHLGVPRAILDQIELGWEGWEGWEYIPGMNVKAEDEAEAYELGLALGLLFFGDYRELDVSPDWRERVEARLQQASA